jgi:hypothetical protein
MKERRAIFSESRTDKIEVFVADCILRGNTRVARRDFVSS